MRPTGVYGRFLKLKDEEWARAHLYPANEFRTALMTFLNLAGRLRFHDLPERAVLIAFHQADAMVDDASQRRTGTDFERRSIPARAPGHRSDRRCPRRGRAGTVVPSRVLEHGQLLAEGIGTPYLAARTIANMGYHDSTGQLDRYGLVAPLTELAERCEDHPDQRAAAAAEITDELVRFLAAAG